MDTVVAVSVGDMIASLQSQSAYMDEYAENMQRAAELGVDQGLIAQLSDGSVESAAILKGIVEDGGENVDRLNKHFQKVEEGKEAFSDQMAKMATDFDDRMDEITSRMDQLTEEMDRYDDAADAGSNTVQGAVDAIRNRLGDMYEMGRRMGLEQMRGYRNTTQQASPSRAFKKLAHNTTLGVEIQVQEDLPAIRKSYENLAEVSMSGYRSKMEELQLNYTRALGAMNRFSEQPNVSNSTVNNSNRVEVHNHYSSPAQTSYADLEKLKRRERRDIVRRLMPK